MSDISIRRVEGLDLITLRGDISRLAQAVGKPAPASRQIVRSDNSRLMWMAPDELLWAGAGLSEKLPGLEQALEEEFATVVDVSDGRVIFEVEGAQASGVIAKLMPVDVAALAPDELRRTRLAQVAAALWREGPAWRIMCFRSVADYVEEALKGAASGPPVPIAS